jgi:peptidoglycan/LPS O-acetylase OafA/YrhL
MRLPTSTSLSEAYSGRANSVGFLRLVFATAVLVSHTWVLGTGHGHPFRVDLAGIAVAGFFGLSGFLISRSARRSSLPRYLWHRLLRIFPGYWVCLAVTAFVVAPLLWLYDHGTIRGLLRGNSGAIHYVVTNSTTVIRQFGIMDLLVDTPYGRLVHGSVFDGSLWTLSYELLCYVGVAGLAVLGVLKRARLLVLLAGVAVYAVVLYDFVNNPRVPGPLVQPGTTVLVHFDRFYLMYFGFMFLLGAIADLYSDRIPINNVLGVSALVIFALAAFNGWLFSAVLPVFAYVLLWLGVRLPKRLHVVGLRNDYSYGVYIYAFVVQQVLAKFGVPRFGLFWYFLLALIGAFACAYLSWHLVEKRAMRLKDWSPRWLRRRAPVAPPGSAARGEPASPAAAALAPASPAAAAPAATEPAQVAAPASGG